MNIDYKKDGENNRNYIIRVIRNNIINLSLLPGSVISENEVASLLHTSRTPVREALIELRRENLIEIKPQIGSYIAKIDYKLIDDVQYIRLELEKSILRTACKGISEQYLDMLSKNLSAEKIALDSQDYDQYFRLDNEFHHILFSSVDKEGVYYILQSQAYHLNRLRKLTSMTIVPTRSYTDHENIIYALQKHDYELAEMIITRHITRQNSEKQELMSKYPEYFTNHEDPAERADRF